MPRFFANAAVRRVSIPADYFIKRLKELVKNGSHHFCVPDIEVDYMEIMGCVDLAAEAFADGLVMERIYFRDKVRMNNCKFGNSVSFISCVFDQPFDLGRAVLDNGLLFADCTFGTPYENLDRHSLVLDDAKISGDVAFFRTAVHGCVVGRRLALSGNLEFCASVVEGNSAQLSGSVDLSNSEIKGSVQFDTRRAPSAIAWSMAEILDGAAAPRAVLKRSSFIDHCSDDTTSVALRGAVVTESVNLAWSRYVGRIDLHNLKCRQLTSGATRFGLGGHPCTGVPIYDATGAGGEGFGGAQIDGSLVLSGGDFGFIHLRGISITGDVMLIDGRSGQIKLVDASEGFEPGKGLLVPSQIGNFLMSRWHCSDFIRLHATRVGGKANVWGLHGITIKSSQIDRGLSFWPGLDLQGILQTLLDPSVQIPKFFSVDDNQNLKELGSSEECRTFLNRWKRRLSVTGNINITRSIIGEDLDLTGVDLTAAAQMGDAVIDISHSTVRGSVTFRSAISYLDESPSAERLLRLLALALVGQRGSMATTSCQAVDLRGLQADNVDLTGLHIPELSERDGVGAGVNLADAKILGTVATFVRLHEKKKDGVLGRIRALALHNAADREHALLTYCCGDLPLSDDAPVEASGHIPGALDVQHAEIGKLVISDASFRTPPPSADATKNGIVLDHATINKLYVARSMPNGEPQQHNGFPVPLSLLDLSVKTWFLEDEGRVDVKQETTSADLYLDLLDNDPVFRMSSYLTI